MPTVKMDKETILKKSIHLFKVHGYYKTSMADLAKECGLIKGSFYHHFKSKQDLGLACLQYIHNYFNEEIFNHAYNLNLPLKERLTQMVDAIEDYFLNSEGGCLLGNWALEVINDIPEFKDEIQSYFTSWEDAIFEILQFEYDTAMARKLSKEHVANTQGALMMMRLYNNEDIFFEQNKRTKKLLS